MKARRALTLLGVAILVGAGILLLATKHNKPMPHHTLLEVIDVKGTCKEDHVQQAATYSGQVVRWRNDDTGEVSTYGSVTRGIGQSALEEVQNPTKYHPPFMVEFWRIDIDTNQPSWLIHGVSDQGEGRNGYATTCKLVVTNRGTELVPKPAR